MAPPHRVATCILLAFSPVVILAQPSPSLDLEPAATSVSLTAPAGAALQEAETLQLTDAVIDRLASDKATVEYAEYFAFDNSSVANPAHVRRAASAACKTFPGDATWPKKAVWDIFNALLGGALIPTKPVAASCYDSTWGKKDPARCADVSTNWTNAYFHTDDPTSNMWPIYQGRTCMPKNDTTGKSCTLGGFPEYSVKITNVAQIQLAAAEKHGVTVLGAVSWSVGYAGGMITGGGQNPLAGIYGMAADHVVAFQVVTADGRFITVSEDSNPDIFWALRGGGGGTFAIVTSVIIRAHPRLNVVGSSFYLDATNNSLEAFWDGVEKYYEFFLDWAEAGFYSFFIMGNTPAPFLSARYIFAPNHTLESYNKVVKPFFDYLDAKNINLTQPHIAKAHSSFYSAYQAAWGVNPFPIGRDDSMAGSRIIPKRNFQEKFNQTFALIKEHVSTGKHLLGYHKAPKKYANANNAVHPAWRECGMFMVTSTNKSLDHSTPEALAIASKDLQENILQPWRDISPVSEGGGTYLNEAHVDEKDWQESFYGGYYPRLSEIKRKWDPNDVFYATTAVGSERWKVEDGEQGVQTQNGRLCRV
ncbi:hypothetical protein GGP41_010362 [Bipolaris sorokiniana]|uniref:FAD-binding PCMH-type domain-containing protein n=1 Tax=Cochliobolus sativus TaxID=45130 RepID=A0A8H5ZKV6_COCSA|nr:hypothetical protein GGP41_010362 [Bipolaris sorokiniana]